jgi:hypothetical protein
MRATKKSGPRGFVFGSGPAAAHARQLKRFRLYAEHLGGLVRRSLEAAFSTRTTAGAKEEGTQ